MSNPTEAFVSMPLPDPLLMNDGTPVTSADAWRRRRSELLDLFAREVYGRMPPAPTNLRFEREADDFSALDGLAAARQVAVRFTADNEPALHLLVYLPASAGAGPGAAGPELRRQSHDERR